MWFLLLQIFLLMLLAAAFGAALAWWWMRRRFEDVTETHAMLMSSAANQESLAKLATGDEIRGAVLTLNQSIAGVPRTDLAPVLERVGQLERTIASIRIPAPDMNPVVERLRAIDQRLTAFSFDPISNRVASLTSLVEKGPDFGPLQQRLTQLEQKLATMQPDLGPVHSGIVNLGLAVGRLEQPVKTVEQISAKLVEIESQLKAADARIAAIPRPDLAPMQNRLMDVQQAVGAIKLPVTDLSPVLQRIEELDTLVSLLDKPPTDLSPVQARLAALDGQLAAVERQLHDHVDRRAASVEQAVSAIRVPETDLSPVLGSVDALGQHIDERLDLRALENRLTSIEFGLAAVHDMLRNRSLNGPAPQPIVRPDLPWSQRQAAREMHAAPAAAPVSGQPQWEQKAFDPINGARRGGDQANLLKDAAFGPADNLEDINGVGSVLAAMLYDMGVFYFWQVAEWSDHDIAVVDGKLAHFRGRITRDDWVRHARELARQPSAARRPAAHR